MPKFRTKNTLSYLGIFGLEFENNFVTFEINTFICLISKFCEIKKMSKFGTKNALFGYFWVKIKKNYCYI